MVEKVRKSCQKHILVENTEATIEAIYVFWGGKRGQQPDSLLRQFWKRYSFEDSSPEAIFKCRNPSIVVDPKSRLRKKGPNLGGRNL